MSAANASSSQSLFASSVNPPGVGCVVAQEYDSTAATPTQSLYEGGQLVASASLTGALKYALQPSPIVLGNNRISLTDGNSHTTRWSYDALNRVKVKTYADTSQYSYAYDPAGNLASRTDAMSRVIQYSYNPYNQVAQVTYPTNSAVNFSYDATGRLTNMTDISGTTTWSWDSSGRNTGSNQSAIGQAIGYTLDAEGHRMQMNVGPIGGTANWTTTYGYDVAGRLSTILDSRVSNASPFTYAYQNGTNWVSGHSNADGSAAVNQYDVLGRLTSISAAGPTGAAINTYAYSYDAAGQRTQEASSVGTHNFGYDNLRQLTSAYGVNPNNNQPLASYNYSYGFDSIGNWTQETSPTGVASFTANNLNQYTAIAGAGFASPSNPQYDGDGNMTSDGNGHTYLYDEENRLVEVDNTAAVNGVVKTVSVYDGLNRRVEKRTYDSSNALLSTTRYLYDGNLPVGEYDATNTLTRSYTRGLDVSGSSTGAGGVGGLLALANTGGQSYSYFCDGNGNVVDLSDANGGVDAHYQYDPFGNVVNSTGTLQQSYQWSSQETDASAGLVAYLYRFYNPSLGRWVNRDPSEEDGGMNLYAFLDNSPCDNNDIFGLRSHPAVPPLADIPGIERANGYKVAPSLLDEWFAGGPSIFSSKTSEYVGQPYDNTTMTMDWILTDSSRAKADYEKLIQPSMYVGAALPLIKKLVGPYVSQGATSFGDKWFDPSLNPIERDLDYQVQHQVSKVSGIGYIFSGATDVDAALGNFNFDALVGGSICYDDSGAHVTVDTVGTYAKVAFAFPPGYAQDLGYWNNRTNYIGYFPSLSPGTFHVSASDFVAYRKANPGTGKDFWAFTDVKQSKLSTPVKFDYP
jgi:RHS repeat-associated protein